MQNPIRFAMYIPSMIPEEDRKIIQEKYRKNVAQEKIFGSNPALIVVDMTNGFVEDRFPTGFSKTGKPCAGAISRLLDKARKKRMPVIFTRDMTDPAEVYKLYRGAWNSKTSPIEESQREDYNTIYRLLEPRESELVIQKSKPSAFFGTSLIGLLNYLRIDSVIVTGMVTSGCVRATVVDAFSYNLNVIVPIECVADRSQISHEVTLYDLDAKYANVLSLDEVIAKISSN